MAIINMMQAGKQWLLCDSRIALLSLSGCHFKLVVAVQS